MTKTPTSSAPQFIMHSGKPAYAVIPYSDYLALTGEENNEQTIPHAVIELQVLKGLSALGAWRRYRKMTQAILAEKTGVTQAAVAQYEKPGVRLQETTRDKLAAALNIPGDFLEDE